MPGHRLDSVGYEEMNEARNIINSLHSELQQLAKRDPDHEISEYAYRPIDAALRLAAGYVGEHPVVLEIRELFSPEAVTEGRDIRVAEVLPVVAMLASILNLRVGNMAQQQREENPLLGN